MGVFSLQMSNIVSFKKITFVVTNIAENVSHSHSCTGLAGAGVKRKQIVYLLTENTMNEIEKLDCSTQSPPG